MKKSKLKAQTKKAKKTAAKDIKIKLITDLTEVASKLGKDSKKIRKAIEKESGKLAKKISGKLKLNGSEVIKAPLVKPEALITDEIQPANTTAITKPAVRKPRVTVTKASADQPAGVTKKQTNKSAEKSLE